MGSPGRREDRPRRRGGNASAVPDAVRVPEPDLLLTGCAPFSRVEPSPCPTCGSTAASNKVRDRVGKHGSTVVACLRCDRRDDRWEGVLAAQRHVAGPGRDRSLKAERGAKRLARAAKKQRIKLSEIDRRRIWCGNKRSMLAAVEGLTCLAAEGRRFLAAIDQLPDWSLILDRRGKVLGTWNDADAAPSKEDHPLNLRPDEPDPAPTDRP